MSRPKTGKAFEVLNCRVPQGLNARISAHADLHGQLVRDVVATALLAYLDGTRIDPFDNVVLNILEQTQYNINKATSGLCDVLVLYLEQKGLRHDDDGAV